VPTRGFYSASFRSRSALVITDTEWCAYGIRVPPMQPATLNASFLPKKQKYACVIAHIQSFHGGNFSLMPCS
jgi:hypothetical protein